MQTVGFDDRGFIDPIRVMTHSECRSLEQAYRKESFPPPLDWTKGYGPTARLFYELAGRAGIVDVVRELIGDDIMLWGTQMVIRPPGAVHSFHTDAETSNPDRKSVSVWIGIRNTSAESSLLVIPESHCFGRSLQQALIDAGINRFNVDPRQIEDLAREYAPDAQIEQVDMSDGDALFFDGRLWHGSHNTRSSGVRYAALLQYATPDMPIRIPDLKDHSVPPKFFNHPRPPCVMVHGSDNTNMNRFESGPVEHQTNLPVMTSWIRDLELPLLPDESTDFKAFPKAKGSSATLTSLNCHVSALGPGKSPHAPHEHSDEELLITLSGELDILDRDGNPIHRTVRGNVVYYPAHFKHSVSNAGPDVANYVMFKWTGDRAGGTHSPVSELFDFDLDQTSSEPQALIRIFDRETAYLRRLRCHQTVMAPGAGYEPHVDAYDVAILTLKGTIETLGQTVDSGSVIFYVAGEQHGIRCVGPEAASYLVFEFHGGDSRFSFDERRDRGSVVKRVRRRIGAFLVDYPRLRKLIRR